MVFSVSPDSLRTARNTVYPAMPRPFHETLKQDPRLHLPGWWRDSNGLILPTSAPRPGGDEPLSHLSPEFRPQPAPIALEERPPAPTDQFFSYIDEELLEVQPSTLHEVCALVRALPAEPSLVILAKLMARVHQLGFRAREQLALAHEFYGRGELLERFTVLVRAEPSRRIFAEQHLLLLFWLLVCEAHDSDARELTADQYRLLKGALLGCSSVVGDQTKRLHDSSASEEWLAYFAQLSALYRHEMPLPPLARAQELLARSRDQTAREDHQYCPLDQWHRDTFGLDIEEQLRLAFGLSALAQAFDQHRNAGKRVYLGPEVVDDFLVKAHVVDRRDQALALISATRSQLAAEFGDEHRTARAIWDATPFKRAPFLRCRDGGLILLSPKFAQSWFTEGFHFRSLHAAQRLDGGRSGRRRDSHVQRYLNFTGRVYERYCLELARSAHARTGLQAARVLGEQPFSKNKRKRPARGEKTSDIAIDIGHDLVLIETTASRLTAAGLHTGDLARITGDLDRAIVEKINQLDNCINHLTNGYARLPGVQVEIVKRIWPVIVSFGAVQQNPVLWEYLDRRAPDALRQARVMPLTLLDPEEYELLCGLVEAGYPLPELLGAKTSPLYARLDFACWLTRDPHAPKGGPHRPALVEESFARATAVAVAGIDFAESEKAA
jgi:hypothetical protein